MRTCVHVNARMWADVCVCVCACVWTRMCRSVSFMSMNVSVRVRTSTCLYEHVFLHIYMCTCVYAYVNVCVRVRVHVCKRMCTCMCIIWEIHDGKQLRSTIPFTLPATSLFPRRLSSVDRAILVTLVKNTKQQQNTLVKDCRNPSPTPSRLS